MKIQGFDPITGLHWHGHNAMIEDLRFLGDYQHVERSEVTQKVTHFMPALIHVCHHTESHPFLRVTGPYEPGDNGDGIATAKLWTRFLEDLCG